MIVVARRKRVMSVAKLWFRGAVKLIIYNYRGEFRWLQGLITVETGVNSNDILVTFT